MPPLFVDGVEIDDVRVDGIAQDTLVVDGVTVWERFVPPVAVVYTVNVGIFLAANFGFSTQTTPYGTISPPTHNGNTVIELKTLGSTPPAFDFRLSNPLQIPGVDTIRMESGVHTADLPWDQGLGRYHVNGTQYQAFHDYFANNLGNDIIVTVTEL